MLADLVLISKLQWVELYIYLFCAFQPPVAAWCSCFTLPGYFRRFGMISIPIAGDAQCESSCVSEMWSETARAHTAARLYKHTPLQSEFICTISHTTIWNSSSVPCSSVCTCVSELQWTMHTRVRVEAFYKHTHSDTHWHTGLKCIQTRESTNHKSADFHPVWTSQIRFNIPPLQLEGRLVWRKGDGRKGRQTDRQTERCLILRIVPDSFQMFLESGQFKHSMTLNENAGGLHVVGPLLTFKRWVLIIFEQDTEAQSHRCERLPLVGSSWAFERVVTGSCYSGTPIKEEGGPRRPIAC